MANLEESNFSVEERLRSDLTEARRRYEDVKGKFDTALEMARNLGLNQPDGSHAVLKASREYNHCLTEYKKALEQFCEFILRRKLLPK